MRERMMTDQLIEIIAREAELFESFLGLMEEQQAALRADDVQELNRVTEQLREKSAQSQLLDKERRGIIDRIKQERSIDGDLNASRLVELLDAEQADRLKQLRRTILDLHDRIAEVRNTNAFVLNRSREYMVKTMELLSRVNCPGGTYGHDGAHSKASGTLAMDRRA